jgi:photosystem II stability/assembly factor-like uncharacterized protein
MPARPARVVRVPRVALCLAALLAPAACRNARTVEEALRAAPRATFDALAWEPAPGAAAAARGASLRGVRVVGERVAWASGSRGTVLRTTDGGATWRRLAVPDADSLDFRSVWAHDSLTAVVASAGEAERGLARIYRTADGGRTWALVHRDTARGIFYDAVAFWDRDHGLVLSDPVGGAFLVLATDDGGRTWRRTPRAGLADALPGEAAFAAGNAALAVAGRTHAWFVTGGPNGARIHHTSTGGARWDAVRAPVAPASASAGLFAVAARAVGGRSGSEVPTTILAVAAGGDYRQARTGTRQLARSDDGVQWIAADLGEQAPGYWSGLAYVPGTTSVVAVGGAGTALSRDDGRTWAVVDTTTLNAVSFASPTAGYAVGPGGRVLRIARPR